MIQLLSRLIPYFYPGALCHLPRDEKVIYATFDDGPTPECLPFILKTLGDYEAKGTFFCVGENAQKHPGLMDQIIAGNHRIANHSTFHNHGWKTKQKSYISSVERAEEHTGSTKMFRPPYGKITSRQYRSLRKRGFQMVFWDILTEDFNTSISPEKCLQYALKARAGSIVVFHDNLKSQRNLEHALPQFLEHYSQLGYRFEAIPQ